MEYRFQVSLGGIIDLLSNHTYSSPGVYIRELLQNGVDAILARRYLEPEYAGQMSIKVSTHDIDGAPFLTFRDDGIGLTAEEVHLFLATIGQTSKREYLPGADFLGHFGVGLLSCFMVSDEVLVVTRSAKANGKAMEWRGRADGTYLLREIDVEMAAGTEVRLHCKRGQEEFFAPELVQTLARHYGSLLPFPVNFVAGDDVASVLNDERPPWKEALLNTELERDAFLAYGRETFGLEFFDYIPLRSTVGDVQGVAFVLPFSPSLSTRKTHRVYLRDMLLSEQTEGLLPEWAFFVKCIVNANDLRPTVSREAFHEDETLVASRDALGQQLRHYLIDLAEHNPLRLKKLIQLHFLSIKALAVDDDEFFRIFIKWLPFETNMGTMTLTEYIDKHDVVSFAPDLDRFRQTARIAAAQQLCVINAGYTYDAELIQKLVRVFPRLGLSLVDGNSLTHSFEHLTIDEQDEVSGFLELANQVLGPFNCMAEIREFSPGELPALYTASSEALFKRTIETAKEVTDSFWSSILDDLSDGIGEEHPARLCFNHRNPVVYKLARLRDEELLRLSIQILYVQAILLSHRPLNAEEMKILNEGLLAFINWGADAVEGWVQ